jgi:hypothetical protein
LKKKVCPSLSAGHTMLHTKEAQHAECSSSSVSSDTNWEQSTSTVVAGSGC